MRFHSVLPALLLMALSAAGPALIACKSSDAEVTAENIDSAEGTLIEDHEGGSIVWHVAPDGKVRALVKSSDGKPVDTGVNGTLTWKGPGGDAKIPLALDEKEKLLAASGPKLEGDLTEVKYEVAVAGKTWSGALHLPAGGTKQIVEDAKKSAAKTLPKGKVGPNGGVIQVVGDDIVEVVADKTSGEVRVYVLDADLKPIAIGDRQVKLGFVGSSVETIALTGGPGGLYFVGKLVAKVNPVKLTIVIIAGGHTHCVIVGYSPGVHIIVHGKAPSLKILVAVSWNVNVKVKGPGVIVVHDDDDDDDDHYHGHGHGHGKHKW